MAETRCFSASRRQLRHGPTRLNTAVAPRYASSTRMQRSEWLLPSAGPMMVENPQAHSTYVASTGAYPPPFHSPQVTRSTSLRGKRSWPARARLTITDYVLGLGLACGEVLLSKVDLFAAGRSQISISAIAPTVFPYREIGLAIRQISGFTRVQDSCCLRPRF